jgi:hypothetical protein
MGPNLINIWRVCCLHPQVTVSMRRKKHVETVRHLIERSQAAETAMHNVQTLMEQEAKGSYLDYRNSLITTRR